MDVFYFSWSYENLPKVKISSVSELQIIKMKAIVGPFLDVLRVYSIIFQKLSTSYYTEGKSNVENHEKTLILNEKIQLKIQEIIFIRALFGLFSNLFFYNNQVFLIYHCLIGYWWGLMECDILLPLHLLHCWCMLQSHRSLFHISKLVAQKWCIVIVYLWGGIGFFPSNYPQHKT